MNDKPRIGTTAFYAAHPDKLCIFNSDYGLDGKKDALLSQSAPWSVTDLDKRPMQFTTHAEALAYALRRIAS